VERILAISEVIRRNVLETCPLSPEKVLRVHPGVDLSRFYPPNSKPEDDNLLWIGMVGRLSEGKGHEDFLRAAYIVSQKFPQARFLIVGNESPGQKSYGERIKNLTKELLLQDSTYFVGFQEDIPKILASLDIFVFPSKAEAFGMALVEAMAMGLPVVAYYSDGVLDILEDRKDGISVAPGHPEKLAEAIIHLLSDEDLRRRLGKAARAKVEEQFNLENMVDKIESVYYDVLQKNSSC